MSNLKSFLAENALKVEKEDVVVSRRFLDDDGKPCLWQIGCITSAEDEALRKLCTKRVSLNGRKNDVSLELDYELYLGKLAAKCTISPCLSDSELQDSYGVMGEDALLKAMLTPGEYSEFLNKVQTINGYDVSFEDLVNDAKN